MSSNRVPDEIKTQIDNALDNLNSPEKLSESELLSLCMVARYLEENPSILPYQALKTVLADILDLLEEENSDYAIILRGRFWEGLSPTYMIAQGRPKQWSEKSFYNHQKKARAEFYSLLWQKEQNCLSDFKTYASADETVHPSIQIDDDARPASLGRKSINLRWVSVLAVFVILAGLISFFVFNKGITSSLPTSTPAATTPATALLTATLPSPTSTAVSAASVCGETEQIPVDLGVPRFVRSQGLSRFTVKNTPGLLNDTVRSLAIDRSGLWIGYFSTEKNSANGLAHYDKKSLANCDLTKIIAVQNINALAVSQSGKLWVGAEKDGIASFDGKQWTAYTKHNGLPSNEIYGLTIDDQDNVWAGTWEGVAKFDGTSWSVPYQAQNDTIFNNHISFIAFDSEKNIWVGHISDGVSEYRQKDNKWIHYTTQNGLAGDKMRAIIVRPKSEQQPESVWFATADGGISRVEDGTWITYQVEDGLPSNAVSDLALDRYGRIWATTDKGVSYFDDKIWKLYDSLDTTTIAIGNSCPTDAPCPFDDDQVLTSTPEMGLTHSRLPLPVSVIEVLKICFVTTQREERICPTLEPSFDTSLSESIITATFPSALKPDDTLRFEITVSPQTTYQLREDRGDFISNTDADDFNLFNAWPSIGVKGTVEPGEPYLFTDYDNPFIAPQLPAGVQEKQFTSTWRVWMHTRYVGPYIHLVFTVKNP